MAKAKKIRQLSFSLPNRIGLLSELTSFLTAARINIEAIRKAKRLIAHMGADVETEDVIAVEMTNKVGQLQQVAKKISDAELDISYVYGSPVKGKMTLILKTADDNKALKVLNK